MNIELLIAVLFVNFGTLIIVAAVSAAPQSSVNQSLVSQSISRHSADEQERLIAVKLYKDKITPEIMIRASGTALSQ